jgi:hypothetical protein
LISETIDSFHTPLKHIKILLVSDGFLQYVHFLPSGTITFSDGSGWLIDFSGGDLTQGIGPFSCFSLHFAMYISMINMSDYCKSHSDVVFLHRNVFAYFTPKHPGAFSMVTGG